MPVPRLHFRETIRLGYNHLPGDALMSPESLQRAGKNLPRSLPVFHHPGFRLGLITLQLNVNNHNARYRWQALSNRKDAGNLAPFVPILYDQERSLYPPRVVFDSGAKAKPNTPGPHDSIAPPWLYGARSARLAAPKLGRVPTIQ